MSDTARPKSGGDKLAADEINRDLPIVLNAGETITGATLPVAVYVKNADGEVYACDADDLTAIEFIGFAVTDGTDGNPITIQKDGVVSGFSGLTINARYYVQDDKTIGVNPGTHDVLVGVAVSATQIRIIKDYTTYVQTYTADATWTKPTGAKMVEVICVGAGGGGGGGSNTASQFGGSGGGGRIRRDHPRGIARQRPARATLRIGNLTRSWRESPSPAGEVRATC
jgi:hypothetical protein